MENNYESGYARALKAAGFNVMDYQEFGSYQGDWFAFVEFNGKLGFIRDTYGSCSGCDAFQHDCPDDTEESLKSFGKHYIEQIQSYEQTLEYAKKHSDWDQEALKMVEWVKKYEYKIDFDKILNNSLEDGN